MMRRKGAGRIRPTSWIYHALLKLAVLTNPIPVSYEAVNKEDLVGTILGKYYRAVYTHELPLCAYKITNVVRENHSHGHHTEHRDI